MGATALTLASAGGHLEVVKKLVGLRVPVSGALDTCPTPLITAVFRNFSPICVYLISRGAPIDACLDHLLGLSALSCSIFLSSRSMLITLLDRGADPEKRTFKKKTSQELAYDLRRDDVVRTLFERRSGRHIERKDIRQALMEDDFVAKDLFEQRHHRLPFGCTPLHFSAAIGNINAVRCLGQDRKLIDEGEQKIGLSPLQTAALLGQADVLSHLIEKGASITYMNSLKMTAFDCYIANGGESNDNIRSALHCFRPKKSDWSLGGSSATLARVLPVRGKEWISKKLMFSDRPVDLPPIEARQWRETRMHTFPMQGRNYQKLVTVEEMLYGERTLKPKKCNGDDSVMEVMRGLAAEATSFAVTCFYDWYTGDQEKKVVEKKPPGEYDAALKFSMQYGFPTKQQHQHNQQDPPRVRVSSDTAYVTLRSHGDSSGWMQRRIAEPPKQPSSRTTPRTLKKQRDSVVYEDNRHQELRKTNSTGLLSPSVVAPRPRFATFPDIRDVARKELSQRHMYDAVRQLEEAEVEGFQLMKFSVRDFEEIGLSPLAIEVMMEVKKRFSGLPAYSQGTYH